MAQPQTRDNLAQNPALSHSHSPFLTDPDPGEIPPESSPETVAVSDDLNNEDPELIRQPKRRKHCPTALENLDELTPSFNPSFTFTFDTKFCAFAAEITPKFGSFNSIIQEIDEKKEERSFDSASVIGGHGKGETVRQDEEDEISEDAVGELESAND